VNTLSAGLKLIAERAVLMNDRGMCYMPLRDYDKGWKSSPTPRALAQTTPDTARNGRRVGMLGRYDESLALYKQVMAVAERTIIWRCCGEARGDHKRAELDTAIQSATANAAQATARAKPVQAPAPVAQHAQLAPERTILKPRDGQTMNFTRMARVRADDAFS